jgi:hypothetical protein
MHFLIFFSAEVSHYQRTTKEQTALSENGVTVAWAVAMPTDWHTIPRQEHVPELCDKT